MDQKNLERKLLHATKRMQKSVQNAQKNIQNEKIILDSLREKAILLDESIFGIVSDKLVTYFEDKSFFDIDKKILECLIKSETAYYLLITNFPIEPLSIAISYNKIIDIFIENSITKKIRKKFKDNKLPHPENIFGEKRIYSAIKYDYTISMGVVSSFLENKNDNLGYYEKIFWETIKSEISLKNIFENQEFINLWQEINSSEVFSEKRHFGDISIDEIKKIRKLITGNLEIKNSLLHYIL